MSGDQDFVRHIPVREAPILSYAAEREALTARPEIIGYSVCCPSCHEPVQAPNSLIGLCIWRADELRTYPTAACAKCGLVFAVGTPEEAGR